MQVRIIQWIIKNQVVIYSVRNIVGRGLRLQKKTYRAAWLFVQDQLPMK